MALPEQFFQNGEMHSGAATMKVQLPALLREAGKQTGDDLPKISSKSHKESVNSSTGSPDASRVGNNRLKKDVKVPGDKIELNPKLDLWGKNASATPIYVSGNEWRKVVRNGK